ncbi:hypothetical protein [Actinoallomurus rhizosphaericola]|uniref:hypothetical protein n=1 Tax=Actinoallomurus rhizosphaericola TaxID=2952536 RepID=UPI0020929542|nr:hypothetical protein [Actinoallomurus rhizosphaericola]MCO5997267.1 hypothetical protein [Actinoallomurus rhizosphaericola]
MTEQQKFDLQAVMEAGLGKRLDDQRQLAVEIVAHLHSIQHGKSPAELISYLNKFYLGFVTAAGARAGAAAIAPTGRAQVPVASNGPLSFLDASVLYTLSVAEINGLDAGDIERRIPLVTAALIGNAAASTVLEPLIGRTAPYWGKKIVRSIPMSAINAVNDIFGPRFVTKYGTKQGRLVLGKQAPMLIGGGIGAGGNFLFGWLVIKAAKKILGPPPESWDAPERTQQTVTSASPPPADTPPNHGYQENEEIPRPEDAPTGSDMIPDER